MAPYLSLVVVLFKYKIGWVVLEQLRDVQEALLVGLASLQRYNRCWVWSALICASACCTSETSALLLEVQGFKSGASTQLAHLCTLLSGRFMPAI